jgi:hypothetical protein
VAKEHDKAIDEIGDVDDTDASIAEWGSVGGASEVCVRVFGAEVVILLQLPYLHRRLNSLCRIDLGYK